MLIYDDSFSAVMTSSQREATRLGARAYGSEHVLLGLLSAPGPVAEQVLRAEPGLTVQAVRAAVEHAADDVPHLRRLGIEPEQVLAAASGDPSGPHPTPRNRHTPEWQAGLNSASAKLNRLHKGGALPRERKVSSAVLWLAVLEPNTRAHRLLAAMGLDADRVRGTVLAALAPAGEPAPAWPQQVQLGLLTRLVQRALTRANVTG